MADAMPSSRTGTTAIRRRPERSRRAWCGEGPGYIRADGRDRVQPSGILRIAEIAYVVLILAVAGIVWREASVLPPAPYDPLGPKTFPIWASYALAALGLAMALRLLFGRSLGRTAQIMVPGLE